MMGFLYDVFFYVTLTYLSYATTIMHSHGISAIGIYKVLFMKQYVTRNEQQFVDIFHHDCSNLRITHYVVFCNITAALNNTLNLRVRILAIQSYIPM